MKERYEPQEIEPKWQARWDDAKAFAAGEPDDEAFYLLEMLPYPSGRIHMGHVRNYSLGDALARFLRLRGRKVLHPMGWDAFGMPAENAAIARKRHPKEWTYDNIAQMRVQLRRLGLSYDWDREFATCDPSYYRHEQAIFLRMLEAGLAYRKGALANWCPHDETVLANEQVEDGKCWRCGTPVVMREMAQWFLRTTKYAQELLDGHAKIDWPESVIKKQQDWIGRSEGAEIHFGDLVVFTTRPDTLYGVTFISIAAEHPRALELAKGTPREAEVREFVERIRIEHRTKRDDGDVAKEGVFTGRSVPHPLTGADVPIWIANFVLMDYGTGAVMAVPAHDQRDFEFATKYGLKKQTVIAPTGEGTPVEGAGGGPSGGASGRAGEGPSEAAYVEAGVMVNSGSDLDGKSNEEAKRIIVAKLEGIGKGRPTITYRLRDWLVSRQRYWGCPIPIVYCDKDGLVAETKLPVLLPDDVQITGTGGSPLARHPTFSQTTCPKCGGPARRETDTFDTFVESSWYFDRYTTPRYEDGPVDPEKARAWLPIDLYIGGEEHAVMHLVYARFWQYAMIDLGFLPRDTPREPFAKLRCQGSVCNEAWFYADPANPAHKIWVDAADSDEHGDARLHRATGTPLTFAGTLRMAKTKLNGVEPNSIVERYGADTARTFVLFAAPPETDLDWNEAGVQGANRFLARAYRVVQTRPWLSETKSLSLSDSSGQVRELRRVIHRTVDRVTRDLGDRFQPNTAIAALMELVNALTAFEAQTELERAVMREGADVLAVLLSPFAPHLAAELHEALGGDRPFVWPVVDASALREDTIEIPVQINGKVRGRIQVAPDADDATVLAKAIAEPSVVASLAGKAVKKSIYVKGRIVTLVV